MTIFFVCDKNACCIFWPNERQIFSGTNRLLDKYSVTGFWGRFVSNYYVSDIPDIGSNTGFSGQSKWLWILISTRHKLTKISWYNSLAPNFQDVCWQVGEGPSMGWRGSPSYKRKGFAHATLSTLCYKVTFLWLCHKVMIYLIWIKVFSWTWNDRNKNWCGTHISCLCVCHVRLPTCLLSLISKVVSILVGKSTTHLISSTLQSIFDSTQRIHGIYRLCYHK